MTRTIEIEDMTDEELRWRELRCLVLSAPLLCATPVLAMLDGGILAAAIALIGGIYIMFCMGNEYLKEISFRQLRKKYPHKVNSHGRK